MEADLIRFDEWNSNIECNILNDLFKQILNSILSSSQKEDISDLYNIDDYVLNPNVFLKTKKRYVFKLHLSYCSED